MLVYQRVSYGNGRTSGQSMIWRAFALGVLNMNGGMWLPMAHQKVHQGCPLPLSWGDGRGSAGNLHLVRGISKCYNIKQNNWWERWTLQHRPDCSFFSEDSLGARVTTQYIYIYWSECIAKQSIQDFLLPIQLQLGRSKIATFTFKIRCIYIY